MPVQKSIAAILMSVLVWWVIGQPTNIAYAQNTLPTPDQLDQLLAPVALYPDALLAQICTASTDPQQVLDAAQWVNQNQNITGQARTDAAQQQGFDPAFIALVNFPQVLNMMAQNINDYAAIGQAFASNQAMVMDSVQRLRQQAYAAGALQSNQQQTVDVQNQNGSQVVVIQPANPQVVYVPQYNPEVIFAQPSTGEVVAASLLTFGAGIALGAWINNNSYPWGWGGWGWNWGRRNVIVHNSPWGGVRYNRYRPPRSYYHYRPPVYNRPVYVRPPSNWNARPYYRPPSGRPPAPPPRPPVNRPPPVATRPPANRPPSTRPPSNANIPARQPSRPTPQYRPNQNAGYSRNPGNPRADSGGRTSAFGGGNNRAADQAAMNRGRSSVAAQQSHNAPRQNAPRQNPPRQNPKGGGNPK